MWLQIFLMLLKKCWGPF